VRKAAVEKLKTYTQTQLETILLSQAKFVNLYH